MGVLRLMESHHPRNSQEAQHLWCGYYTQPSGRGSLVSVGGRCRLKLGRRKQQRLVFAVTWEIIRKHLCLHIVSTFTPGTDGGLAIPVGLKYWIPDMAGLSCQRHTFTQGSLRSPPCDSSHVGVIAPELTVCVAGTIKCICSKKDSPITTCMGHS